MPHFPGNGHNTDKPYPTVDGNPYPINLKRRKGEWEKEGIY
ncbi:hypothetical protein BACCAP_00770 [Pseudoflavonifractor capillosus ATCC 29799]|uniref:Uncharacterized protein n=1 Tax=Pseudoflavonifractor capillosus ATCC 29799 TaxID=411467 RepID=A6NRE2_9FIRM|nr:hypothetical protein BACCAP_00770 [Pseudoflavonifractor capillosus ATCC 29799]